MGPRVADVLGLHAVEVRLHRGRRTERSCKPAGTDVTAWGREGAKGSPCVATCKSGADPLQSPESCVHGALHAARTRSRALHRGRGTRRERSR